MIDAAAIPGSTALATCLAAYCILSACETVHACFVKDRLISKHRTLLFWNAVGFAAHLALGAMYVNALGHGWLPASVPFGSLLIPMDALLWANVAIAALGVYTAFAAKKPIVILGSVAALVMTPFVLGSADKGMLLNAADLAAFACLVAFEIAGDAKYSRTKVSASATMFAVKNMPQGIAYAAPDGRVIMANDTMRQRLLDLGVAVDLSSSEDAMAALICAEDGENWYVESNTVPIGNQNLTRIVSLDVSEERALERSLEDANLVLEQTRIELERTLENVRDAAFDEALIHMRSRLHDVIGQRLSMLHRYLEDDDIDYERLEKMKPMLEDIIDDLREDSEIDWKVELDSIVSAFSLVGVNVKVEGTLPEDHDVAVVCAAIIREASTNAVKHASATQVKAVFGSLEGAIILTVEDNGRQVGPKQQHSSGQGLSGMRSAIEKLGGTLDVQQSPSFTLTARFPNMSD